MLLGLGLLGLGLGLLGLFRETWRRTYYSRFSATIERKELRTCHEHAFVTSWGSWRSFFFLIRIFFFPPVFDMKILMKIFNCFLIFLFL